MYKDKGKKALILMLKGGKGPMDDMEEKNEELDDSDMGDEEKYEAMGQDLLDALAKKDAVAVGQVLADIHECLKG